MLKRTESIPELLLHKKDIVIESKKQYEKLSEKQYEALKLYKFNGYTLINKFLRGGNPITYNINYIGNVIHTTKTKKDDTIRNTTHIRHWRWKNDYPGDR